MESGAVFEYQKFVFTLINHSFKDFMFSDEYNKDNVLVKI